MFRRRSVLCLFLALAAPVLAAEPSPALFARVEIAPTKTSIYLGTVSMTMPPFVRRQGVYEADYVAKVFPFFFLGEKGRLAITVSDDALRRLARGEPVDFEGHATNESGTDRRVAGRATPAGANSGGITVRVFVSKRIQLTFHTTYRFLPDRTAEHPAVQR